MLFVCFFFSSRRRHTRWPRDWSSDVCSSDLHALDASRRGGEDVELEPFQREPLPSPGNPPERLNEEPAHRLNAAAPERDVERLLETARGRAAFELDDAHGRLARRLLRLGR